MNFPVLKGAGYVLLHAPEMVINNGTTQTTERAINPDSDYLKQVPKHLRTFEEVVSYMPNQVYIGGMTPEELGEHKQPWHDKKAENATREGKYGEIMPQDEFIGMMKIVDAFDLVKLTEEFTNEVRVELEDHPGFREELIAKLGKGDDKEDIEKLINEQGAEGLFNNGEIVGCVKKAHEIDTNLSAHVLFENLAVKASGALAIMNLIEKNNINPEDVEYVIECSEEACGDMNQRGGGNFAKALAETAGLTNATGSDTRGFCAAPTHAIIEASALVQAGVFKNVVVAAGGSTAKLGMNGKDHIKKGFPILEDTLGGFAVLISENDGENPIFRTDIVGRHTVGTGSSP